MRQRSEINCECLDARKIFREKDDSQLMKWHSGWTSFCIWTSVLLKKQIQFILHLLCDLDSLTTFTYLWHISRVPAWERENIRSIMFHESNNIKEKKCIFHVVCRDVIICFSVKNKHTLSAHNIHSNQYTDILYKCAQTLIWWIWGIFVSIISINQNHMKILNKSHN